MFIDSEYGSFQIENPEELLLKLGTKELPKDFEMTISNYVEGFKDSSWKGNNHKFVINNIELELLLDQFYEDDPEYDEGYYYLSIEYIP